MYRHMWGDTLYQKIQDQEWIVGCWGCWVTQKGWTSKSSSKSDRKSFLQTIDNLPEHWFSIGILHVRTEVYYCWGELVPCADGVPCGEAKKSCQGWGMTGWHLCIWESLRNHTDGFGIVSWGSPKWLPLPTMARSPISSERCLWSLAIWKVPRGRPGRYNSSISKLKPGMIALFYKMILHFSADFQVSDGR